MASVIPIHDFSKDDHTSIEFKYIPLNARSQYDTSMPHRHNYYELLFFVKGGGEHIIDFKKVPVRDHSIHFISPGQVHQLQRQSDSLGSILIFSRDKFYKNADQLLPLSNYPFLDNNLFPAIHVTEAESEELQAVLQLVAVEQSREQPSYPILKTYVQVVLLQCMRIFEEQHTDWKHQTRSQFYDFRLLVDKEFRTHKMPSHYASVLCVSERKLNEICKDALGVNVGTYIKERVLLEAKRLLYNSDSQVQEIADFLGFEDPAYFNRFFKTNVGMTASEFRKNDK